jgi:DNA-binding NarL/FixJ family response regulator
MSVSPRPADLTIGLLLIDDDPIFRVGTRFWLRQYPDLDLVAEAADGETALQILDHQFARDASPDPASSIQLVLLEVGLGRNNADQLQGLTLCNLLKSRYPRLPILGLGAVSEPVILSAIQQTGADGYCPKNAEVETLVAIIRRVARGQSYWPSSLPLAPVSATGRPTPARKPAPLAALRRNWRQSGTTQIDAALTEVNQELRNLNLSLWERAVLAGRQRELRAARWLVNSLLATPYLPDPPAVGQSPSPVPPVSRRAAPSSQPVAAVPAAANLAAANLTDANLTDAGALARLDAPTAIQPAQTVPTANVRSLVFDRLLEKVQANLINLTEVTLEVDILRDDKKRELFYLVLRKLEEVLDELRYSQVEPVQIPQKRSVILLDLWQAVLVDFFGRYYTVSVVGRDVEVVETLLREATVVQTAILDRIPGVTELIGHLLFQAPLAVNSTPYPTGNPESLARAELLMENLTVQVANAVMQPLLNRFATVEAIKQNFYDRRLLSSRELERFRNNLSWRYRFERLYHEPKNIFESQFQVFTLTERGIQQTAIYAPRTQELEDLTGLPYVVTLALETRDAIAPRLRSAISLVGNSLVYVLTEVIGRGIGLVGRGVLKGLGNVWQDTKYGRDRQQR